MHRLSLAAVLILSTISVRAAERVWTGAANNLWSNPANWSGGVAPVAGDSLTFANGVQTSNINDYPAGTAFGLIHADSANGPWTFSGNAVTLMNGITSGAATYAFPITLGASQTFRAVCCDAATISGSIDLNGQTLTLIGNTLPGGNGGEVIVSGPIVGAGSIVASFRRVTFSGNNTYSGPTQAYALVVQNANGLGVADGTTANGTLIQSSLHIANVAIGNEAITFNAAGARLIGTGTASVNGPIFVDQQGQFYSESGGDLTIHGAVTGTGELRAFGTGSDATLTLTSAANSFPYFELLYDLRVILGNNGVLPSNAQVILSGGVLDMNNRTTAVRSLQVKTGATFAAGSEPITADEAVQTTGTLTLTNTFDGTTGVSYTIIRNDSSSPVLGEFVGLPEGGSFTLRGQTYFITYQGGDGNDVVLHAGAVPLISTTTVLTSSQNPADEGNAVMFTATVNAASGNATGTVTFYDGATPLVTVALNGAHQAKYTTSTLPVGTHSITVQYNASSTHAASTSAPLSQVINDAPSQIAIDDASVVEGNGTATFDVTLLPAASSSVSVQYATSNGTATAAADFIATSGTLTFLAGETHKSISVEIVDDATNESEESFAVQLSNVTGDGVLDRDEGFATIVDDDAAFVTTTHEYAKIGARSLLLDLTVPLNGTAPYPVIVWIHAGGWQGGSRAPNPALREVARGYAVVSVDYRLSSEAKFPAQIADVKGAIRWLRANASQLQIDSRRIGAWGHEAGAHLAALLGTATHVFDDPVHGNPQFTSRVLGVVAWGAPTNLARMDETALPCSTIVHGAPTSPESQLLGCAIPSCVSAAADASPVTWASSVDPAFLIMHGEEDCFVPPAQAVELFNALDDAGVNATLQRIDDVGGLNDPYWASEEALSQVDAFFDATVKNGAIPGRRRAAEH